MGVYYHKVGLQCLDAKELLAATLLHGSGVFYEKLSKARVQPFTLAGK
jgi:hypothetical protein